MAKLTGRLCKIIHPLRTEKHFRMHSMFNFEEDTTTGSTPGQGKDTEARMDRGYFSACTILLKLYRMLCMRIKFFYIFLVIFFSTLIWTEWMSRGTRSSWLVLVILTLWTFGFKKILKIWMQFEKDSHFYEWIPFDHWKYISLPAHIHAHLPLDNSVAEGPRPVGPPYYQIPTEQSDSGWGSSEHRQLLHCSLLPPDHRYDPEQCCSAPLHYAP